MFQPFFKLEHAFIETITELVILNSKFVSPSSINNCFLYFWDLLILLANALVEVKGPHGKYTFCTLLDSCSQSEFISKRAIHGFQKSFV